MSPKRSGWTLPIRRWLVLALAIVFIVPVVVTGATVYHVVRVHYQSEQTAIDQIGASVSKWNDPAWQAETRDKYRPYGVDFVLVQNGQTIFSSRPGLLSGTADQRDKVGQEFVVSGSEGQSTFIIYADQSGGAPPRAWLLPIVAISTLLLTLGGIAWFLGRMVLAPLAATGDAARQIAAGNLEFDLPTSRVREVAEVSSAFTAMSDALRESLQHQAEVEQERRLFIGAIVHDLRTPVFSLRGYLEGLQQGVADTPEKRHRYVEIAQEKASALERLITDLFEFTRLEYLDQSPSHETLDLGVLLTRLADGIRPQADAKGVTIEFSPPPQACIVVGDAHLLTRAAENLLTNAVRHTPSGGSIRIEWGAETNCARFSVRDTGPGIADVDLPHLFTPLYRGERSRSRRTGGVGLGLTIARRIMLAHNGDLTVQNHPLGGAVFTGILPKP